MDRLDYLQTVQERGRAVAAKAREEMIAGFGGRGFNSFMGVYLELAKMELQMNGLPADPIRVFAIDAALDRIDARLDCADFAIPALIRMLRAHRGTERLHEDIASRIEKSLLGFKYWLDEPGEVRACYFTENHQILYHSAEYLAGGMFPDAVFLSDGKTGAQHKAHGYEFLSRWLTWREQFGFSEWLTQGYYMEDMLALAGLMAYAEEESVRTRSRMLIDTLMLDLALNGFQGHLPTTHGRVYARFILEPDYEDCSPVMALMWDEGCTGGDLSACAVLLAAYGYRCPKAIAEIAISKTPQIQTNRERMSVNAADARRFGVDPADYSNIMFFWGMQTYSDRVCIEHSLKVFPTWNWMTNRVRAYRDMYRLHDEAGAPCADAPDYTAMTQADIYTRRTPDYILSCAQDFRRGRMGYQQHPWTASLGGKAILFTTSPASLEYEARPNRWAGNLCLPRAVAHENVLLCIYRILPDFVDYLWSHLYFPRHAFDEVREAYGCVFGRRADGYVAVTSLHLAYWEEKDPALFQALYPNDWREQYDAAERYEYVSQGYENVWAVEMGSKREYGSFDEFIEGFARAGIEGDSLRCRYASPSLGEVAFGWNEPLTVEGKEIEIHDYKRYDSPFCQAEFGARRLEIACGGHKTRLDYENAVRIDE